MEHRIHLDTKSRHVLSPLTEERAMEEARCRPVWAVCAAVVVAAAVLSLLWTDTASTQVAPPGWRCYPAKQPNGATKFVPVDLVLNGTFQGTMTQALKPVLYCDPVNNGGLNSTESPALVCYSIKDASGTPKFPGATVDVTTADVPFNGSLSLKKSKTVCVFASHSP
jgi:hypothetical protein